MYATPAVSRRRPPRSPNSFGRTSFAAMSRLKLFGPTFRRPCVPDCRWLKANGPRIYRDSTAGNDRHRLATCSVCDEARQLTALSKVMPPVLEDHDP